MQAAFLAAGALFWGAGWWDGVAWMSLGLLITVLIDLFMWRP